MGKMSLLAPQLLTLVSRPRMTWRRQHVMSRKDLRQSTARGGQNERVSAPLFLTMRDLGLAYPRNEPRHTSLRATSSQRLRSISVFVLLSGALWHHFCWVCLRYLTLGTP